MKDPITKYRVYIKKKKLDILGLTNNNGEKMYQFKKGTINGQTGIASESETPWNNSVITLEYIPVENNKSYIFKKIGFAAYKGYICEYDQNKNYLNGESIIYDINYFSDPEKPAEFYIPSQNAHYIRLMFENSINDSNKIAMFEKTIPIMIHDSSSPDYKDHLLNANLHLEDCSAGTFEFAVHSKNPYYKIKINLWTDTIYVTRTYRNGSERIIWDGRPITEQIDSDGIKSYHCEGALSYLNDVRIGSAFSSSRGFSGTVYDFIDEQILTEKNENNLFYDCLDRSFYHYKENGKPMSGSSIIVDQGTKYLWVCNYESGLKWINDIKESFGGHFKIRYRPYDSPIDDTICRSFTMIQDFNRSFLLPKYSWSSYSGKTIKKNEYISYLLNNVLHVYKALVNFKLVSKLSFNQFINSKNGYSYELKAPDMMDAGIEIIDNNAYIKPENNRFSKLYATFNENVFNAQKSSEINDFATRIIPKGIQCYTAQGDSTNIYLDTQSAYMNGDFSDSDSSGNKKAGLKNFDAFYEANYIEDNSLIKTYGLVTAVVTFENADTPKILRKMAIDWFKDLKKEILKSRIQITLSNLKQDLVLLNSSDPYTDPEFVDIWTRIYAIIPFLGITEDDPEIYFVSSMDIPLDDHLNTTLTLINNDELLSNNIISAGDIKGSSKGIIDNQA